MVNVDQLIRGSYDHFCGDVCFVFFDHSRGSCVVDALRVSDFQSDGHLVELSEFIVLGCVCCEHLWFGFYNILVCWSDFGFGYCVGSSYEKMVLMNLWFFGYGMVWVQLVLVKL